MTEQAVTEQALETALIRRCRAGQHRFYEPLVRAHEPEARRVAAGILGDMDAAADAVQEAFIKAYRALDRFDPGRPFRPWFLQILRNQCRDALRKRDAGFGRVPGDADRAERDLARVAGDQDPERDRRRNEAREILWRGLGQISVEHREVLVLKEIDGMGYREIAETVGVAEGTVASRLHHARRALKRALDEMGVGYP